MEAALERGNVVEAISHLETMIISSPPEYVHGCLANHTVNGIPTLEHLAQLLTFEEEDRPSLDKLIKIFTDFGYDINKTEDSDQSEGYTALTSSVANQNPILMECLLRQGARVDIRDRDGFTPCHWAVLREDLNCLKKLVQFGGPSVLATTSIDKSGFGHLRPLLHMAVDYNLTEIMSYLLSREEFGVDVNEKCFYRESFDKAPTLEVTPMERAVRRSNTPVLQVLLNHPRIKFPGPDELHLSLKVGNTEMALILLDYVSDKQLASANLTLHCLHSFAFQLGDRVEFTKKLILEYVWRRGWDINSVSGFTHSRTVTIDRWPKPDMSLTRCTLLNLACLYKGQQDLIELLVELGADINCKTEGDLELTPLQISMTMKQWRSAAYLIDKGADLGARGSFKNLIPFQRVLKTLTTWDTEDQNSLNAVELLVRMGREEGLPILDKVLTRTKYVWHGANEFYLAVEGGNPVYISKILEHCAEFISVEELRMVTFLGTSEKVPMLLYLLGTLKRRDRRRGDFVDVPALAHLINLLVSLGYDLNLSNERSFGTAVSTERILYPILEIDLEQDSSNLLLRTVLNVDHFRLNWPELQDNPVGFVLWLVSNRCFNSNSRVCWNKKPLPPSSVEVVKLLVTHGLDVTGIVIDSRFTYHFGYNVILKMLYLAGAKISDQFFNSPQICHPGHPETQSFLQEIAEVKRWKDEFDRKEGYSLKRMCRLRVRKMLKCVGDLKQSDILPGVLKDYVLCKTQF